MSMVNDLLTEKEKPKQLFSGLLSPLNNNNFIHIALPCEKEDIAMQIATAFLESKRPCVFYNFNTGFAHVQQAHIMSYAGYCLSYILDWNYVTCEEYPRIDFCLVSPL